MKVLHVLYQSFPNVSGSSTRSNDIILSQKEINIDVCVVTSPFQRPLNPNNPKTEVIDGVKYYRTYSGKKEEEVSEANNSIKVKLLKMLRIVSFSWKVCKIAKTEKIDIIHAHAMFFCAFSAKISSLILHIPMIYEVRSLWEERDGNSTSWKFRITRRLENMAIRSANRVVVINNNLKANLVSRGFTEQKFEIVPNAIYLKKIKKKINGEIFKPITTFGYVGSISPIEGLDFLIRFWHENSELGKFDQQLLIVGEGVFKQNLEDLVASLNAKSVIIEDGVSRDEVPKIFDKIDVIINPRLSSEITENVTPLKPLEAMAYGKILVVSDVGGMKELVENGKTGFLFKSGNAKSLLKVVHEVVSMGEGRRKEIISNAQQFLITERNWEQNALKYEKIYNNLIKRKIDKLVKKEGI